MYMSHSTMYHGLLFEMGRHDASRCALCSLHGAAVHAAWWLRVWTRMGADETRQPKCFLFAFELCE